MKNRIGSYVLALLLMAPSLAYAEKDVLGSIHEKIISDYPQVEHINADQFTAMKAEELVIFDVREKKEYAVSHLAGAIQVDPDISAQEFADLYSKSLKGKTTVFYCSVGRRSSKLAKRVEGVVESGGAIASYNLEGGAFRWRNEERQLMSTINGGDTESTDKIHPYNWYWSRLIQDKKAIKYSTAK